MCFLNFTCRTIPQIAFEKHSLKNLHFLPASRWWWCCWSVNHTWRSGAKSSITRKRVKPVRSYVWHKISCVLFTLFLHYKITTFSSMTLSTKSFLMSFKHDRKAAVKQNKTKQWNFVVPIFPYDGSSASLCLFTANIQELFYPLLMFRSLSFKNG